MASLTFGSVGDIVTVCGIIIDVVKALSESRGSAADYQGLIRELWSLAQVLESVGSLLEEHSWLPNHGRLETILQNCKRCLDHYLKQIKAFEPSLGQNTPRVSAKDIYRKVRWLSRKDERSKFRAAVASHVSSISAILIASGLDFSQRAHHYTNSRLEDVLGKLQISCDEFHATQNRNRIEVLAAVAANDEAQLARHEKCELLQITHYEELRTRLSRLELTTTANNNQKQDVLICMNTLMEDNRAYFQLLLEILKIFASFGLVSFVQLMQLMQHVLMLRYMPVHPTNQRYLVFQDAIFREFCIDVDLIPYESFTGLIEDKFRDTIGSQTVQMKNYIFEDKLQQPLQLAGAWSSEILGGRHVFMRAVFDNTNTSLNDCPACGVSNGKLPNLREIKWSV
ncbi:hypothetical protein MMC10_010898 [Thelotrema lepadinum]|nr:hypothetical protein [Thelotrema lepadinum]